MPSCPTQPRPQPQCKRHLLGRGGGSSRGASAVLDASEACVGGALHVLGPVLALVVACIATGAALTWATDVLPWYASNRGTLAASVQAVVALMMLAGTLTSYATVSRTPAGVVPETYRPPLRVRLAAQNDGREAYAPYWCHECERFRPKAAAHCGACGVCVARHDHHCPWINNCVGARNHAAFLRFLLWTQASALYVTAATTPIVEHSVRGGVAAIARAAITFGGPGVHVRRSAATAPLGAFVLACALGAALALFISVHLFLACTNQTSAEFSDNKEERRRAKLKGEDAWVNPHDLGSVWKNLASTLGVDPRAATVAAVAWAAVWPLAEPGRHGEADRAVAEDARTHDGVAALDAVV